MKKTTEHVTVVSEIAVAPVAVIERAIQEAVARAFAEHPISVPAVMTTAQAAGHMGASEAWIRTQVRAGHLKEAAPSNRRRLLVTRQSVDQLLTNE